MRSAIRWAALGLLVFPASLPAQSPRDKIVITSVRLGFPPGPHSGNPDEFGSAQRNPLYKPGAWTPVYVQVSNTGKYDPRRDGPAAVVLEVFDCDDTAHNYVVPLPPFNERNDPINVIAYTRAGSRFGDFVVRVLANDREMGAPFKQSNTGLDTSQFLYLALGSRLPGLKLPGPAAPQTNNPNVVMSGQVGRSETGLVTRVEELPPLWFGYGAADVVILSTSDKAFTESFIGDTTRTAALAEWVRRGGHIVVCAGRNRSYLLRNASADLAAMLPMEVGKEFMGGPLQVLWKDGGSVTEVLAGPNGQLEVTEFLPRANPARGYRVLVEGPKGPKGESHPLVVQGAYGLGRVTLVGIDLDQPPFTKWPGQQAFWEQLLLRAGPRMPTGPVQTRNFFGPRGAYGESEADSQLQSLNQQLEAFEGVPVISFGWVALFILLYILVVGPLDYLFLKKVVGRLELTWITFPTVVLAVSAAAYFTAYYLKGSELRVNKMDLVDLDLQTGRAYGHSWFSVFSPRIQKYTVGVEPAPSWVMPAASPGADTVVSWFGVPKQGRQSLFRHSYDYAPEAAGLLGVPIQVWTTKGFQSSWQAGFDPGKPPVESRLRHPPGRPDDLIGSVVSHLPAALEDVILIYRGEVATLGPLLPETPKTVSAQNRTKFGAWLSGGEGATGGSALSNQLHLSLLFHEATVGRNDPNNASLRHLDESWRLEDDNRDEVILVGRLPQQRGGAEELTAGAVSPSRLWLGELPSSGKPRPPLSGTLRQDTLVRVFIPVTPEPRNEK